METRGVISMDNTVGSKSLATVFFVVEVQVDQQISMDNTVGSKSLATVFFVVEVQVDQQ
jgi:hypothetical protein